MLVEAGSIVAVIGLREAAVWLVWLALSRRLEWGRTVKHLETLRRDAAQAVT